MKLSSWFDVLREINLKKIQLEAEGRFALLVIGDPADTGPLAAVVGRAEDTGARHPWVSEHPLPLPEAMEVDLPAIALVVSPVPDLDPDRAAALRRLKKAGVRTVAVVLADPAGAAPTAWLARANEDARTLLPPGADDVAIRAGLSPALALIDRSSEGSLFLAMARQLPVLREPYIKTLTEDVARTNAGFALSTGLVDLVPGFSLPLTAADIVVLTKNQILMGYRIALAAGKPTDSRVLVGEVAGVIGAGVLLRQIARELVGLIPGIGLVPKIAIAYAGTHLVGIVVRAWALEGRKVDVGELRHMYETSIAGGKALAEELMAKARRDRGSAPALTDGTEEQH